MKAPYGSWRSPITATRVAEGAIALGWPQAIGETLFWVEMRPRESGRYVVVRRAPDGRIADVTPGDWAARTLVHEYGGGMYEAFARVDGGESVIFSELEDQRLYRQDLDDTGSRGRAALWSAPWPLTAAPPAPRATRYADGRVAADRRSFFSVRERHLDTGVVNDIVTLPAEGGREPLVVASGHDFFSSPRPSPDGGLLARLCWDHPRMPWDGTELWVAALGEDGDQTAAVRVAGGEQESVVQPLWAPDGGLLFVSDRSGWWNLYRIGPDELAEALNRAAGDTPGDGSAVTPPPAPPAAPLLPMAAEFAKPHWVFGLQNAVFLPDGRLAAFCSRDGLDRLVVIEQGGDVRELDCELTSISSLVAVGDRLGVVGGGADAGRPRRSRGPRERRGRDRALEPFVGAVRGVPVRAAVHRVPDLVRARIGDGAAVRRDRSAHGPRPLLRTAQPRRRGAGRAAAAARHQPRRPDRGGRSHAQPLHPVLDLARLRRRRRELRRLLRLRPRAIATGSRATGASSTRSTASMRRGSSPGAETRIRNGSRSAAAVPAATRRSTR